MASARICLQWTVLLFNTICLVLGVLAIIASIYELEKFNEGSIEHLEKVVQLGTAAVLVLTAIVGCLGAGYGSRKILALYILLLCALIVSHIWRLFRYNESNQLGATEDYVAYTWLEELVRPGAMNTLQKTYECCGKKSYTDYTSMRLSIPNSCYIVRDHLHSIYPYSEGCMSAMKRTYLEVYRFEKWTHAGLIGFELLGIILAITLSCQLSTRRYNY